jgi:hypothetical protein
MNKFTEIVDTGQAHLNHLRYEARLATIQPKQPSLRRQLARILKNLVIRLESEPQLTHS